MNGKSIELAVHAVFIAVPDQQCTRSSLVGKRPGSAYLAALPTPWAQLASLAKP